MEKDKGTDMTKANIRFFVIFRKRIKIKIHDEGNAFTFFFMRPEECERNPEPDTDHGSQYTAKLMMPLIEWKQAMILDC
jgi:hypothetical protein